MGISLPQPRFSQGVLHALLRDEKYSSALKTAAMNEKLRSMRYRPSKGAELALARIGVFEAIPTIDILPLLIKGKLPRTLFELEHDREFLSSSRNIQMNRIRALVTKKETKHSGSRRQRKIIKTTLISSEVSLNEHVISRLHQRSSFRNPTPEKLFFPTSDYLRWFYENMDITEFDANSLVVRQRQDILYPYGSGAFLGTIMKNNNDPVERYDLHQTTKKLVRYSLNLGMPVFVAKTFINHDMMTSSQKLVCEKATRGDIKGALKTFCSMDLRSGSMNNNPLVKHELICNAIASVHTSGTDSAA